MSPTSQVIVERNKSFALCTRFRFTRWYLATIALLSAVLTLGCGGGTQSPAPVIQVSVAPPTAQVALMEQIQFSATVSGASAGVSWSVNGGAGGNEIVGVINSTGLYTAPIILPSPNTVSVTATSLADSTRSATSALTIVNPASVINSISPTAVSVGSGDTRLTVTGSGFSNQSVVEAGATALARVYVTPPAMMAVVPAAQLASAGNLAVQVMSPAPGGGTSSAAVLAVLAGVFATKNPQVSGQNAYRAVHLPSLYPGVQW